ncbi:putative F-box domain, leucine-rich repeat domain superfamily, F-box-like domain superfamily [Helianthus annuus]|uniref:F-box domain, leucine-rich repeat domain superfamily, F-box-like domain superfamily n=1 Tax=Helianthus annuus TaxID=4232 RepID=A0A9K3I5D4_HELAN|nr:putative F-box domain, leucine-rich repeat domain superfamily, F-box-like domain superfamily [Helianthus annuus]KAJ0533849.1 putative F-box domain, leucine-rich repeat domain superfamily, F-box-like domain superfamily [Helianthus annuus]
MKLIAVIDDLCFVKEGCEGSKSDDLSITDMPYAILMVILSLLPVEDAVVTSSVTKKWRFLWSGLTQLNFDARKSLSKIAYNKLLYSVNKKVEILELDLQNIEKDHDPDSNYDFPLTFPSSTVVELVSLKKLYLNNVTLRDSVLEELLTRSPHLESISIHDSSYLTRIRVVGRCLNINHFEIVQCFDLESLYLSDFDLVSFIYKGLDIDLCLTNLPKLKKVSIYQGPAALENNVFNQISSCASSLQDVTITFCRPEKSAKLGSIPQLPNLKNLMLTIGAYEDDCLLEFASIAKACPILETFIIEVSFSN